MAFNARRVTTSATTGNLNGLAAATQTAGAVLTMAQVEPGSLCAEFLVDGETNTITLHADWLVSQDNVTWMTVSNGTQNAAAVALVTGTAGAGASVTKVIPAPDCAYSFLYCKAAVRNEVATGTTNDTYSIKYHYMKPKFA